jgi:hypothetical protein
MSIRQAKTIDPVPTPDGPQTTTAWRRFVPWHGPASRTDTALMGAILGVVALGLVMRPLKPFLLASHPVTLEFLTGDLTAIGAAAAFARIDQAPLWLVVVAGAAGMVKLDWLTWWTGRQWGGGIIKMFTTSERAQRFAGRVTELDPRSSAPRSCSRCCPAFPPQWSTPWRAGLGCAWRPSFSSTLPGRS